MTQEPVAWMSPDESAVALTKLHESWVPLYTMPRGQEFECPRCGHCCTQREWVGLTDDEIKEIVGPWGDTSIKGYTRKLFDQIENKLKEKNNG